MTVKELTKDQKEELKVTLYSEKEEGGCSPSYWEIANINELVSDEELYDTYEDVDFTEDDFFCSAGELVS